MCHTAANHDTARFSARRNRTEHKSQNIKKGLQMLQASLLLIIKSLSFHPAMCGDAAASPFTLSGSPESISEHILWSQFCNRAQVL